MSDPPIFVADSSDATCDLGVGGTLTWTGVAGFVLEADGTRIAPIRLPPGRAWSPRWPDGRGPIAR
jgi:hypothetical protein